MTPDDFRDHSAKTFETVKQGLARDNNPNSAIISYLAQIMQPQWEIVAQLSELNEYLRSERNRTAPPVPSPAERDIIS